MINREYLELFNDHILLMIQFQSLRLVLMNTHFDLCFGLRMSLFIININQTLWVGIVLNHFLITLTYWNTLLELVSSYQIGKWSLSIYTTILEHLNIVYQLEVVFSSWLLLHIVTDWKWSSSIILSTLLLLLLSRWSIPNLMVIETVLYIKYIPSERVWIFR